MKIFKIIIISLVVLIVLGFLKSFYDNNPKTILKNISFEDKEPSKFKFKIYYLGFIPLGEVTFENKGLEQISGESVYHLEALAKPNSILNFFYKVNASAISYAKKDKFLPLKFLHRLEVRDELKEEKVVKYDHKNKIMVFEGEKRKILDNTYDPLSLLFFLIKKADLGIGKRIDLNINTNQKNYQFIADVIEKKEYVIGIDTFSLWRLDGETKRRGKNIRNSASFSIYLLNSSQKIPLAIRVSTGIGPANIRLIDLEN